MPVTLPKGNTDPDAYEGMGSLYRDDDNERLVVYNNYEDYDDYEVYVYRLVNGEVERTTEYWDDDTIESFKASDATAYLSGHNLPGMGTYGVFTSTKPNCPECGKFMSPGHPERHEGFCALGLTCPDYTYDHPGYMTQQDAIDAGYYITIEQYLKRAYGSDDA